LELSHPCRCLLSLLPVQQCSMSVATLIRLTSVTLRLKSLLPEIVPVGAEPAKTWINPLPAALIILKTLQSNYARRGGRTKSDDKPWRNAPNISNDLFQYFRSGHKHPLVMQSYIPQPSPTSHILTTKRKSCSTI
jgi:hypothetical protein